MHGLDFIEKVVGPIIALFFALVIIIWAVKYWVAFAAGVPTAPLWFGITVTGIFGTASLIILFLLGRWLYRKLKNKKE